MTEVPTWLLIVMVEALALLLLVLGAWIFISIRSGRRRRQAVDKLVEQIRQQSKLRLEETGSFLEEKYRFEGDELNRAVERIDKAEKLFFQRVINLYLKRDDERLQSLDAWVAELIDVYKSLSPTMPVAGDAGPDEETRQKLTELETRKQALEEELKITKATMGNMISEFGNMFGGGRDSSLDQSAVMEKVVNPDEVDTEKVTELLEDETISGQAATETASAEKPDATALPGETGTEPAQEEDEVLPEPGFADESGEAVDIKTETLSEDLAIEADDEIDELLDGIDLSDGEELEPPK